jgi:hypothetical protein
MPTRRRGQWMTQKAATTTETAEMPTVAPQCELTENTAAASGAVRDRRAHWHVRWMNDAARSASGDIMGQHYEIEVVTADGRRHRATIARELVSFSTRNIRRRIRWLPIGEEVQLAA